jgi:hypothetical protein
MGLTREEIVEHALRYVNREEIGAFPHEGEIFAFLHRPVDAANAGDDGGKWEFGGYAVCIGYTLDEQAKPAGKWLFMEIISLAQFPPRHGSLKLQPPHVALGRFRNPERTMETRLVSLSEMATLSAQGEQEHAPKAPETAKTDDAATVLRFRPKEGSDKPH